MTLKRLDADLWVTESPLRFFGLEVGARMTVVRLPDSKILVHSPISASPRLLQEVEALGPVAYLVAPNRLHHLFVGDWQRAFPDASLYVAPGLESKRADLDIAGLLGDEPEPGWKGTLDQARLEGLPFANEVIFFHRPSATLIATDLAFNIGASSPLSTRLAFRMGGAYGQLAPTLLERLLVRDRASFRRSLQRILAWPFGRVVVAHGEVCESGGREQLLRGYEWILGKQVEAATSCRDASAGDAAALAAIHVQAWRSAYAGLMPDAFLSELSEEQSRTRWEENFAQGTPRVLVAEQNGSVAGFCLYGASRDEDATPSDGEIMALNIHPDAWRRGLGSELLASSLERLAQLGFSRVSLWVLRENSRARAFYESAGFRSEGSERVESELIGSPLHEVRYEIDLPARG